MSDENVDMGSNESVDNTPTLDTAIETARKYQVTVDGEMMEVDEDELRKGYAHNKAASKRMEEAARTKNEAAQVLRMFKENPREVFKKFGKDAYAFAEQIINEELNEKLMTNEQREMRDMKRELETRRNEERTQREEYEKEQMEQQNSKLAGELQTDIIDNLKTSGLPQTSYTIGRMIYYMQAGLAQGMNVSARDVMEYVKKDYVDDIKQMMGGLNEDAVEAFLGQDLVRKVAKSTVKRPTQQMVPKSVNATRTPAPKSKVMSPKDFFTQR